LSKLKIVRCSERNTGHVVRRLSLWVKVCGKQTIYQENERRADALQTVCHGRIACSLDFMAIADALPSTSAEVHLPHPYSLGTMLSTFSPNTGSPLRKLLLSTSSATRTASARSYLCSTLLATPAGDLPNFGKPGQHVRQDVSRRQAVRPSTSSEEGVDRGRQAFNGRHSLSRWPAQHFSEKLPISFTQESMRSTTSTPTAARSRYQPMRATSSSPSLTQALFSIERPAQDRGDGRHLEQSGVELIGAVKRSQGDRRMDGGKSDFTHTFSCSSSSRSR
jgi:hypothetical protein